MTWTWSLACLLVVPGIDRLQTGSGAVLGIRQERDLHSGDLEGETVGTFLVVHSAMASGCRTAVDRTATCYCSQTAVASETVAHRVAGHCKVLAGTAADHMVHPAESFRLVAEQRRHSFAACSMLQLPSLLHDSPYSEKSNWFCDSATLRQYPFMYPAIQLR